jgi:16S rRNA (guanine966-N2)-methyltransferase
MTRIVAGSARGRRLVVPGHGTRPTSERAREALFGTLDSYLEIVGARMLDLYAGTGAVGLEALSRGAKHATFVERNRTAIDVLRRNIAATGVGGAEPVQASVAAYLNAGTPPEPFDFGFADPPYALAEPALVEVLRALADPRWTAPGAIVVVERAAAASAPMWPIGYESIKEKRYGQSMLWYGRRR